MDNEFSKLREFGKFRLDVEKKVLWWDGSPVQLPPKEAELLSVLTDNAGEVVTKTELMDRLWADSFVEESNLSRHVYRLRRIFEARGERPELIETVPRRGYRFTGTITEPEPDVVIERHSFSRTLIEEIERSEPPALQTARPKVTFRSAILLLVPVLFVGSIAAALILSNPSPSSEHARLSVAILPPRSAGTDDHALAFGVSDTLITSLSGIDRLKVLSWSAVEKYADIDFDPRDEGKRLGVDLVVDGTLQKANNKVRVTLRITRISDGVQIWSGSFDEAETEIFRLQDVVAQQTGRAVLTTLNIDDRLFSMKRYTANAEAYEAYLRGRYLMSQLEPKKAATEFQRALQIDPRYALAYAGFSDSLARQANSSLGNERIRLYELAKLKATKALEIDPNLAEAHSAMGWLNRIYDWDWAKSEQHLRRAVELAPNQAVNYRRLAFLYVTLGRASDAIEFSRQARSFDPLEPSHAWILYCSRQYEPSAAEYQMNLFSNNSEQMIKDAKMGTAMAYIELGRTAEAIRLLDELSEMSVGNFAVTAFASIAHFKAGDAAKSTAYLEWLEKKAAEAPGRWVRLAYVYAAIGEPDKALKALEMGFETRDDRMMWVKTTPQFDGLRDDPRFVRILKKMNLPA